MAMKKFRTTAVCIPSKHYMVDLTERVREIRRMVDEGEYFSINRGRQYGKTTTLYALGESLRDDYVVVSLDFQGISASGFATEQEFVRGLARLIVEMKRTIDGMPEHIEAEINKLASQEKPMEDLSVLFAVFRSWCEWSDRGVVLIIDEVDSATNNQVFLDFLARLRDGYMKRETAGLPAFHSVILAGVTDVRHLKSKIRGETEARQNSPWNIAADFTIDMSLSENGIKGMLDEYEADHHTGMDTAAMAGQIRAYTSGYPFLVSRLCELIDKRVQNEMEPGRAWSDEGFEAAVKLILAENNTLFQSMAKNLNNYPDLKTMIKSILMEGTNVLYNAQQDELVQLQMYGLIREDHHVVRIANRIFEMMLYNLFLSEDELKSSVFARAGDLGRNRFVEDGVLNMRLVLEGFIKTFTERFGKLEDRFQEKDGREYFLLYLRPIINGTGNYYIEAQTRDQTRTDVIVDYLGKQYVIELKIWHGERYHKAGEEQIRAYLDYYGLHTGYMLSFNFNRKKEVGVKQVHIGDKLLYEGMV